MDTFFGLIIWGLIGYFAYKYWQKRKLSKNFSAVQNKRDASPSVNLNLISTDFSHLDEAIENIDLSKFRGVFTPERFNKNKQYFSDILCPACGSQLSKLPKVSGTCKACGAKHYMRIDPYTQTDILLTKDERDLFVASMDAVNSVKRLIRESLEFEDIDELKRRPERYIDEALVNVLLHKAEIYLTQGKKGFFRNCFSGIAKIYEKQPGEEYLKYYLTVMWIDTSAWEIVSDNPPAPFFVRNFDLLLNRYSLDDKSAEKIFFNIAANFSLKNAKRTPQKAWWKIMQCVRDYREEQKKLEEGCN